MTQHDTNLASRTQRELDTEMPFEPDEMFFSRTDPRGVIECGNEVFQRISGYDWDELLGAPHKVIRHPDMPSGLFHLFWQRLKADQRVVAYVKNRTKDGRYYWVLALSWPTEGGYLSVRIKPTSPLMAEVEAIYKTLREAEEKDGLSPEKSALQLLEVLAEKGFPDYDSFMGAALGTELRQLSQTTGVALTPGLEHFYNMEETVEEIGREMAHLFDVMREIRTVPMNMRILASRLENAGGPISAISVNYSQMLEEMSTWMKSFSEGPDSTHALIRNAILNGKFLTGAALLQSRMSATFDKEMAAADDATSLREEQQRLQRETERFDLLARETLKSVELQVRRLSRSVLDMKRYVTGLSSSRMMCKIESATLGHSGSALVGIVEQLDQRQNQIETHLARVVELNAAIESHIAMLRGKM